MAVLTHETMGRIGYTALWILYKPQARLKIEFDEQSKLALLEVMNCCGAKIEMYSLTFNSALDSQV